MNIKLSYGSFMNKMKVNSKLLLKKDFIKINQLCRWKQISENGYNLYHNYIINKRGNNYCGNVSR